MKRLTLTMILCLACGQALASAEGFGSNLNLPTADLDSTHLQELAAASRSIQKEQAQAKQTAQATDPSGDPATDPSAKSDPPADPPAKTTKKAKKDPVANRPADTTPAQQPVVRSQSPYQRREIQRYLGWDQN